MELVGIFMTILSILTAKLCFYDNLVHFVVIWYIFFPFWRVVQRKIWQPSRTLEKVPKTTIKQIVSSRKKLSLIIRA
jgi:hypothetical protein